VLLRMAADQERADRIRALKLERPDLTWRRIADYVGVAERSATDWQKKGGIDYDNAKKLAALFEVDVDYIWRGPIESERAPSPFAGQDAIAERLAAIEERVTDQLAEHARRVENLLTRQGEILDRIEQATERERQATKDAQTTAQGLRELLAALGDATQAWSGAAQPTEVARERRAK
jgi:hypothetical protein